MVFHIANFVRYQITIETRKLFIFSRITSLDVLATVLEEMPPFPEKVSIIEFTTALFHVEFSLEFL